MRVCQINSNKITDFINKDIFLSSIFCSFHELKKRIFIFKTVYYFTHSRATSSSSTKFSCLDSFQMLSQKFMQTIAIFYSQLKQWRVIDKTNKQRKKCFEKMRPFIQSWWGPTFSYSAICASRNTLDVIKYDQDYSSILPANTLFI